MKKLCLLLLLASCSAPPVHFRPQVCYTPPACCIPSHPGPTATGPEERIGDAFAAERDSARAIAAFTRAEILHENDCRTKIVLAYYLDCDYCGAWQAFTQFRPSPSRDLDILLFDVGLKTGRPALTAGAFQRIAQEDPVTAENLALYEAISSGNLREATTMPGAKPYFRTLLSEYCACAKSVNHARALNAVLPGAGYAYVGQYNTALTALVINALFVAATVQFARQGNVPAAIICGSLEMGWYVGGIWGAGRAAAQYNEDPYERTARKALDQERLYPVLQLDYAF